MNFFHENICWKPSNETFNEYGYAQLIISEMIAYNLNTISYSLGYDTKKLPIFH